MTKILKITFRCFKLQGAKTDGIRIRAEPIRNFAKAAAL